MSKLQISGKKAALLALVFILAGCTFGLPAAPAESAPPQDLSPLQTQIAQLAGNGTAISELRSDLAAMRTEIAQNAAASQTAAAGLPPTATLPPPTQPPAVVLSVTPLPAATQKATWAVYPTWTRTPYTDAAEFVDQSPRDGFTIGSGGDFDIVWTFKNVGLRPWNTQFYLRYLSGVKGSKATKYMLSAPVNVNDTATFRVDMIAPFEAGDYVTRWQLINDDGTAILTSYLSFTVR